MNGFGLSLAYPEQLAALQDALPDSLNRLEFPGCALEDGELRRKLAKLHAAGAVLSCRELVDRSIAGIIGRESLKMQIAFNRQLLDRLGRLSALGVETAECGFDLFAALKDPEAADRIGGTLKTLAGPFRERNLTMLLAFRLPVPVGVGLAAADAVTAALAFRRSLLLPQLGFAVDVHLHEPGAAENLAAALPQLGFYDAAWRFVFDPELGNRLEAAQVRKLLSEHPAQLPEGRTVCFAPRHALPDEDLLGQLSALAETLRQEA